MRQVPSYPHFTDEEISREMLKKNLPQVPQLKQIEPEFEPVSPDFFLTDLLKYNSYSTQFTHLKYRSLWF